MAAILLAVPHDRLVKPHVQRKAMSRIATHSNPIERPTPSFMLRARLDELEGDENFEQLWTKRVGKDRFELCCIPFFAYDLALGDVVRADEENDYVVQSVEERSGNGVVRIAVKRDDDVDEVHIRLHDLVGRLEYLYEWFQAGYLAINLEPTRSHDELFAGLADLGDAIEIERIRVEV
jgi:hypothetical protein